MILLIMALRDRFCNLDGVVDSCHLGPSRFVSESFGNVLIQLEFEG